MLAVWVTTESQVSDGVVAKWASTESRVSDGTLASLQSTLKNTLGLVNLGLLPDRT